MKNVVEVAGKKYFISSVPAREIEEGEGKWFTTGPRYWAEGPPARETKEVAETTCSHSETKQIAIGIGPGASWIKVCSICKQEV